MESVIYGNLIRNWREVEAIRYQYDPGFGWKQKYLMQVNRR